MLHKAMEIHENTIIMIPSESLNSMGFGNLGATVAYLQNLKAGQDDGAKKVSGIYIYLFFMYSDIICLFVILPFDGMDLSD